MSVTGNTCSLQYHAFHHTLGRSFHYSFYFPFVYFLMSVCLGGHCMEFPPISSLTLPGWSFLDALTYSLPRIKWVIDQCHFIFNKVSKVYWFSCLVLVLLNPFSLTTKYFDSIYLGDAVAVSPRSCILFQVYPRDYVYYHLPWSSI